MSTEYRRGIPSTAHVEAATRLGLLWQTRSGTGYRRRDPAPTAQPTERNRSFRPIRPDGTPVDWEVLDQEVVRVGQPGQPPGFRADLWRRMCQNFLDRDECELSLSMVEEFDGNEFFRFSNGNCLAITQDSRPGYTDADILARWTVYQELKPLYDIVDGCPTGQTASLPIDVFREWARDQRHRSIEEVLSALEDDTEHVNDSLMLRRHSRQHLQLHGPYCSWYSDHPDEEKLRNFAAVLDAVAERRVAERMRGQTQASTVTAAQLDEPVLNKAALRSLILNLPNVASITSRIERGSRQRDRYIVRVQLADPNVPLDRALAAQIPRNVHVHCCGRGDGGQRGVGGTASSIFSPTGNREDAVVPPIRVNVEPRRFADVRPDRHGWRWWRDLTNGYCFTIRDGVYVQRVDAASDPWSALDLSAWLNRTVIPTDEQGNPVSWESIGQGLSGNSIDAVLIDDALGPISPTQPTPLPRFTADELDDVDHSATTTQDSAILKRGKLPTVEAIGKYREVMAKRNGTVAEAVKASGIDCEVAQYVLERWASGLSDREAEIICDKAYGAVSFTRADIAKRLSHWFAIIRPTLDTSEPADTAAQRQRAEAAERKARMAALQAQLAKERAAREAEPVEEPTRFSLLEVDEAADPSKSIEAWKAQRAALKRASVVRPVPAPQPTPPPRRKAFEVVDAQADGLSGGAAFAVLLSRAMNQNC